LQRGRDALGAAAYAVQRLPSRTVVFSGAATRTLA
jgi:hypothetical protein